METIKITLEINAIYDSTSTVHFEGFRVVGGGNTSSSVSINNGVKTAKRSTTYVLRPLKSGKLEINSPVYFVDGKKIKAKPIKVKIGPSKLTEEELKEKEMKEFIQDGVKPEGTIRITQHEDKAYLEIYKSGWKFYRRLTEEEIEQIKKVN